MMSRQAERIFFLFFLMVLMNGSVIAQIKDSTSKRKSFNLTGIPLLSYNSSYGYIIGFNAMAFYNFNKKDTISPPSQGGIGAGYSQTKSLFLSLFAQLYFKEDRWRTTFALGVGNINFQYFEVSNEADGGDFVDYNTTSSFLFLKGMRKIKGHLYGGALFKLQHSNTTFKTGSDSTQNVNTNGVGISALYDSRNNVYSPASGIYCSMTFLANSKWLGSDSIFNTVRLYLNFYHKLGIKAVLAARASIFAGLGNVPFTGQRSVGGKDIRGYTDGRYRGEQQYSVQSEYRWNFYKRWGAVGFFGLAFTEKPSSDLLPGAGVGIRFKAIPALNVNVGVDYAVGKNDHGIYFRINEAF